ncbi:Cytochrome c oxidase accessory protein CcoG [Gammaproteobacteria bacterium]
MTMTQSQSRLSGASDQEVLSAKRQRIYPREVHGRFAMWRVIGAVALLGLYYVTPWIPWQDRQAILFDLPHRKFYIFEWVFWPQDFFYLSLLLLIAAFALFFFTTLAGRLWCGYACPQTVWTEIFLWIERLVEGDRPQQMRLDRKAWNDPDKLLRKTSKHLIWLFFSGFTGFVFVGYFVPVKELAHDLWTFSSGSWEIFWVFFYGFATYLNAGMLREQVCIYMCPYARFQSAMFDKDTLIISYDASRGEPRGSRPRGVDPRTQGLGDCINCTLCVQVCPTGIDIRNGLQEQCIACAACVDVCDEVMNKVGYPQGLIRYTTEHAMSGNPSRIVRPRVVAYAAILLSVMAGFVYALEHRMPLALDIIRDRSLQFRELEEGLVENVYTLMIMNKDDKPHHYAVQVSGLDGLLLQGVDWPLLVPGDEVFAQPVSVRVDSVQLQARSTRIRFTVRETDRPHLQVTEDARFLGPGAQR